MGAIVNYPSVKELWTSCLDVVPRAVDWDVIHRVTRWCAFGDTPVMCWDYAVQPSLRTSEETAAEQLGSLPLVVVRWDHSVETLASRYTLALTVGGVNLTWAIVEAYMVLGFLPPVHFAAAMPRLPGRGASKKDQWLLAGCRRALRVQRVWCDEQLKAMSNFGVRKRKEARAS